MKNMLYIYFFFQPHHHGREGDLEGCGDGRPLREDPEASRSRPWVPQLQEGAWLQGERIAKKIETSIENLAAVYKASQENYKEKKKH